LFDIFLDGYFIEKAGVFDEIIDMVSQVLQQEVEHEEELQVILEDLELIIKAIRL
jgi:hypothetical protein